MTLNDLIALDDSGQFRLRALALLQQQGDYIRQREEALKQAQRWRFGAHSETLPAGPKRSQFEEDADTDIAVLETQLSRLHIKENATLPGVNLTVKSSLQSLINQMKL